MSSPSAIASARRRKNETMKLNPLRVVAFIGAVSALGSLSVYVREKASSLNAIRLKNELEHQRITVVEQEKGQYWALVASVPMADSECCQVLEKHGIGVFGSCGLGVCGLYVPIQDFYRSAQLLQKFRTPVTNTQPPGIRYWVWQPLLQKMSSSPM